MHRDAPIHLFVAWAVGAALAFLAESYRRYSSESRSSWCTCHVMGLCVYAGLQGQRWSFRLR